MNPIKTFFGGVAAVALCLTLVACDEVVVETDTQTSDPAATVQIHAGPAAQLTLNTGEPSCSGSSCAMEIAAEASCSAGADTCAEKSDCSEKSDCGDCADICPSECEEPKSCESEKPMEQVKD